MRAERPVPKFFLGLLGAATALLGLVVWPIASELFLGAVLAGVLWPLQQRLTRVFWGRRGIAAGLLTTGIIIILLGPLAALVTTAIRDGSDGVRYMANVIHSPRVRGMVRRLPEATRDIARELIESVPQNMNEAVGTLSGKEGQAATKVSAAVAATGSVLIHGTFMLIALFFLLVRGDEFVRWIDGVSPLGHGRTHELLSAFKKVSYAVIVSTLITSAVQAAAALVGYLIAQVPNPIFFTIVTFFVAFIPAIGAAAVCIAASLLLFVTGNMYMALFLSIWGIVVVGLADNVVKPLLIRRGMELHGAVVFFSLIGGLAAFGTVGLLIGPLVVSMFLALLRMYQRDFSPQHTQTPTPNAHTPGPIESSRDLSKPPAPVAADPT